jgi:hypothetical protein
MQWLCPVVGNFYELKITGKNILIWIKKSKMQTVNSTEERVCDNKFSLEAECFRTLWFTFWTFNYKFCPMICPSVITERDSTHATRQTFCFSPREVLQAHRTCEFRRLGIAHQARVFLLKYLENPTVFLVYYKLQVFLYFVGLSTDIAPTCKIV